MPTFPLAHTHAALAAQQAKQVARILRESPDLNLTTRPTRGTAAGDERKLRGIPVVGARGVGGAIPGTRPGARL